MNNKVKVSFYLQKVYRNLYFILFIIQIEWCFILYSFRIESIIVDSAGWVIGVDWFIIYPQSQIFANLNNNLR